MNHSIIDPSFAPLHLNGSSISPFKELLIFTGTNIPVYTVQNFKEAMFNLRFIYSNTGLVLSIHIMVLFTVRTSPSRTAPLVRTGYTEKDGGVMLYADL